MSNHNDYNYFDLDNFDDQYSRNNYRRRPQSSQSAYNRRPSYNVNRRNRHNKKRTRNRIIIIVCGILIIVLFIFLLSMIFRGCSGNSAVNTSATISTETIAPTKAAATADNAAVNELSKSYFKTPSIKDNKASGQLQYGIYVWNKAAYELFGSDEQKAKTYATTINGFADKFGSDVKVYDMVVPNHTEMGLPQRIKDSEASSSSQAENIKSIYSYLSNKVTPINCYNYLADHNSEYIYFNTDHHWTGLGAYYSYSAFAKTTGQNVLSLKDCTKKEITGFTGSFTNTVSGLDSDTVNYWEFPYDVSMDITYKDGTVGNYDTPYYKYAEAGSNTYGVFIMGDNILTVLKSSSEKAESGKKIAVVKESYGNAFVPYLTYNYDEVHIIDFRYFNQNLVDYCKTNNIDEVLFVNGVMSANTQIQLDSMSSLFK